MNPLLKLYDIDSNRNRGLHQAYMNEIQEISPDPVDEDNKQLRHILCQTIRHNNTLKKELEDLKVITGYVEKPFHFLLLPREIRDQIYRYCVVAEVHIQLEPRFLEYLSPKTNPWKPLVSGVCMLNNQVYREANPILYLDNVFKCVNYRLFYDFALQIGGTNRDLIRKLEISSKADLWEGLPITDFRLSGWKNASYNWQSVLKDSKLKNIKELTFVADEVDRLYPPRCGMTPKLKEAIMSVFGYRKGERTPVGKMPVLVLEGFKELDDEPQKFPDNWDVRMGRDKKRVEWEEQIEHLMRVSAEED